MGVEQGIVREAYSPRGAAVASEEPIASAVGLWILSLGGNAVDAAVGVSLALAVVAPHLGGIGGDYFALIHTPGGETLFIDGSGPAPSQLTRDLLVSRGYERVPRRGPLSTTVPGMIDALYEMWRRLGSLEWKSIVMRVARLADEGFPAPPSLARAVEAYRSILSQDPGSRETYLLRDQLRPGDPVRFPGLAKLLQLIADDPRSFYEGEPAERIEEYLAERGGVLSRDDMGRYHSEWRTPVSITYRGWRVWEMPPNTQGVTTLHMLSILEQWSLPRDPSDRFYYILSAAVPAYKARDAELGDPRYMTMSVEELLSPNYTSMLRSMAARGPPSCAGVNSGAGFGDTTYYAVVDREGMVVSGIQSLFMPFGSAITEPDYQVTLHGRASGFTMEPGRPNTVAPGKKPLHTLSAVIMESNDRIIALGASGGHFRPQQHALLVTSIVDHGYTLGEAVALPRLLWDPGSCRVVADRGARESRVPPGYEVVYGRTGVAAAVMLGDSVVWAATDPRGDGYPAIIQI